MCGADEGSSPLGKASKAYRPLASDGASHSAPHTKRWSQWDTETRSTARTRTRAQALHALTFTHSITYSLTHSPSHSHSLTHWWSVGGKRVFFSLSFLRACLPAYLSMAQTPQPASTAFLLRGGVDFACFFFLFIDCSTDQPQSFCTLTPILHRRGYPTMLTSRRTGGSGHTVSPPLQLGRPPPRKGD